MPNEFEATPSINHMLNLSDLVPSSNREAAAGELIGWRTVGFTDRDVVLAHLDNEQLSIERTGAYFLEADVNAFTEKEKADVLAPLIRQAALAVSVFREHSDDNPDDSPIIISAMQGFYSSVMELANLVELAGDIDLDV